MKKRILYIALIVIVCILFSGIFSVLGINAYVKNFAEKKIITPEETINLTDVDCIIVLGCGVNPDGKPSWMLSDRIKRGIDLYNQGVAPKILMSGDHGREFYDEVNTMKQIAIDSGIPSQDVFMDHAGFSTYDSMYRAKEIFDADNVVIVSQKYHLYRAVYIAEQLGINAYGVGADYNIYGGEKYREMREILARCKDFIKSVYKPNPTFLGETIPVSGDGDLTND